VHPVEPDVRLFDAVFIQRFLKGIVDLDEAAVSAMVLSTGITANWWRRVGDITPADIADRLTEGALIFHLNQYDDVDPATGRTYGADSPFISVTAGCIVRDARGGQNLNLGADYVAAHFATDGFARPGWVFSGYVFALGRKAVAHVGFAEEVRELHVYTQFLPFQPEGELAAKVHIPCAQIDCAYQVEPDQQTGGWVRTTTTIGNPRFVGPDDIVNLRGLL
jgi:hypothetical protein